MIFVAETSGGGRVEYRDTKRWWWLLSLLPALIPPGFYAVMLATGNPLWSLGPLLFIFVGIPLIDVIVGEDRANPPEEVVEALSADRFYTRLLWAAVAGSYLSFAISLWVFAAAPLPVWAMIAVAASAGVISGEALTVGHELGHRGDRVSRVLAQAINGLSWYGHFTQEHNGGHHVEVATPEDSASARYGESLWRFALREIPHGLRRGWALEAARLEKRGRPVWSTDNRILQSWAISAAILIAAVAAFGWIVLPFFLLHNPLAWLQLTMANYVEHYGLKRARRPDGRYEPCRPHHSWNTNHVFSNLILFHLQRHSDHHANPRRPYQALRHYEDLPHLPSGYPGSFVLAAIPPLWFRVMNPKVMAWAGGDIARVNTGPEPMDGAHAER